MAMKGLPPVPGVYQETRTIKGVDDNGIRLYLHRPEHISVPVLASFTFMAVAWC